MESEILCEAKNQNNDELPKTPRSKAQNSLLSFASNTGRSKKFLCSSHLQSNAKQSQSKGQYVISYNFDHTQNFNAITRNIFIGWDDEPTKKATKKTKSSNPSSTYIGFHSKTPIRNRMTILNKIISEEQQKQNNTQEETTRVNYPQNQKISLSKLPNCKKPTQSNYYSHRQQKLQNKNKKQAPSDKNLQNNNKYSVTLDSKNTKTKSSSNILKPIVNAIQNSTRNEERQQNRNTVAGNDYNKNSLSVNKPKVKNNQQSFQLAQNKVKLPSFDNAKDKKMVNQFKVGQSQKKDYKKPQYRNGKTIQQPNNGYKTLHNELNEAKANQNKKLQKTNNPTLKKSITQHKNQKNKNIFNNMNFQALDKDQIKPQPTINNRKSETNDKQQNRDWEVYGTDTMKLIQQLQKMQSEHIMKADKQQKQGNKQQQKEFSIIVDPQKEESKQKCSPIKQQANKFQNSQKKQDASKIQQKSRGMPEEKQQKSKSIKQVKNNGRSNSISPSHKKRQLKENKQQLKKQILSPNIRKNNNKTLSTINGILPKQKIRKTTDIPQNKHINKIEGNENQDNSKRELQKLNNQQTQKDVQKKDQVQIRVSEAKQNQFSQNLLNNQKPKSQKNVEKKIIVIPQLIYKKPLLNSFIQQITQQHLDKSIQHNNKEQNINEVQNNKINEQKEDQIDCEDFEKNNIQNIEVKNKLQSIQMQETANNNEKATNAQNNNGQNMNNNKKDQKIIISQIPSKSRYINKKSNQQKGQLEKGIEKKQLKKNPNKKLEKGQLEKGDGKIQIQVFTQKLKRNQSLSPKKSSQQLLSKYGKKQQKIIKNNDPVKQLKNNKAEGNLQQKYKQSQKILNQQNKSKKSLLAHEKTPKKQKMNDSIQKLQTPKNNNIKSKSQINSKGSTKKQQQKLENLEKNLQKEECKEAIPIKLNQQIEKPNDQQQQSKAQPLVTLQNNQLNQKATTQNIANDQNKVILKQQKISQQSNRSKFSNKSKQSKNLENLSQKHSQKESQTSKKSKSKTQVSLKQKLTQKQAAQKENSQKNRNKDQSQQQTKEIQQKIETKSLSKRESKNQLKRDSKAAIHRKKQSFMKKQQVKTADNNTRKSKIQQINKVQQKQVLKQKNTQNKSIDKQNNTSNSIQSIINKIGQKHQQSVQPLKLRQNQDTKLKFQDTDSQQQLLKNVQKSEAPKQITCISKKDSSRFSNSNRKQNFSTMQQLQKQLRMNQTASAPGSKRVPYSYNQQQTKPIIIKQYCCVSVQAGQQLLQNQNNSPINVDVGTSVRQLTQQNEQLQVFPQLDSKKCYYEQKVYNNNKQNSMYYQDPLSFGNITCQPKITHNKKQSFLQFDNNQILNKTDFPQPIFPKQQRKLNANCIKNIKQNKLQFERAPILQYIYGQQKKLIQKQIISYQISTNKCQIQFTQQNIQNLQNDIIGKSIKIILQINPWLINRIIEPYTSIKQQNQIWLYCKGHWKSFRKNKQNYQQSQTFLRQIIKQAIKQQYEQQDITKFSIQEIIRMITGLRVMQLKNKKKLSHQLQYYLKRGNIIKGISANPNKPIYNIIGVQTTPQMQKLIQIQKDIKYQENNNNQQDKKIQWIKQSTFQKYFDTFLLICYREQSFWTYKQLNSELIRQTLVYTLDSLTNSSGSLELNCDSELHCKIDLYRQVKPKLLKFIGSLSQKNKPHRSLQNPNPSICFNFNIKGRYYLLINFSDIPNIISKNSMHLSLQCNSQIQIQYLQSIQHETLKNSTSQYVEINNRNNKSMYKDKDRSMMKSKNNSFTQQSGLSKQNLREQFISYLLGKDQNK